MRAVLGEASDKFRADIRHARLQLLRTKAASPRGYEEAVRTFADLLEHNAKAYAEEYDIPVSLVYALPLFLVSTTI